MGGSARFDLPREVRLHLRRDYGRLRAEGRTWADRFLVLSAAPNQLPYTRFGFVVSKRVGKAVCRNRVRRLMREASRLQRPAVRPGWDVVWIARSGAAGADFGQVVRSVESLLRRAGLLVPGRPPVGTDGEGAT